jgi:hypothetical protein
LFISYSHLEEDFIKNFRAHLAPLRSQNIISDWYDRKIMAGEDLQETINNNLNDANVKCLCISQNFLNSPSCQSEINEAMKLKKEKNIIVIAIILKDCYWDIDEKISKFLVLPEDGKAITDVNNDTLWKKLFQEIHRVILEDYMIKKIKKI